MHAIINSCCTALPCTPYLHPVQLVEGANIGLRLGIIVQGVLLGVNRRVAILEAQLVQGTLGQVQVIEGVGPEATLESDVVDAEGGLGVLVLAAWLVIVLHGEKGKKEAGASGIFSAQAWYEDVALEPEHILT